MIVYFIVANVNNVATTDFPRSFNDFNFITAARPYINIIYRKIGTDWKTLARELNVENTDIKKISQTNQGDIDQQCADMLNQYYDSNGTNFTKLMLVKALFSCGLRSVAEIILEC